MFDKVIDVRIGYLLPVIRSPRQYSEYGMSCYVYQKSITLSQSNSFAGQCDHERGWPTHMNQDHRMICCSARRGRLPSTLLSLPSA